MNTKHTPGPWNISSANNYAVNARGRGIATAHGTDDVNYSDFFPPTEEAAANARLIAAAPDGLSANIKALEALLWAEAAGLPVGEHIEQVCAAITKATNA